MRLANGRSNGLNEHFQTVVGTMNVTTHSGVRLLTVISVSLHMSCGGAEVTEEIIRPVRYQQVFATGGARVRTFSGVARAAVEAPLSFRVGGTVVQIPVRVGDSVRAGQLLAQLDPEDYQLQLQDAEGALRQAEAAARNAEGNYERVRALYENNNASLNDLESARAQRDAARAQVQSLQNRVALAQQSVGYTSLRAPQGGAIASVNIEANQNVQPGQVVVLLTAGTQLEVEVAVPEVLIAGIREGDAAAVEFDALPNRQFAARVTEVGVRAGGFATTFPVTVRLNDTEPNIRPGMAAEVAFTFQSSDNEERILVPAVAVGEDAGGRFVFVVERADSGLGFVRRRTVMIGELTDQGLEIVQGLSDGEEIVTAGVTKITDGLRVRLLGSEVEPS